MRKLFARVRINKLFDRRVASVDGCRFLGLAGFPVLSYTAAFGLVDAAFFGHRHLHVALGVANLSRPIFVGVCHILPMKTGFANFASAAFEGCGAEDLDQRVAGDFLRLRKPAIRRFDTFASLIEGATRQHFDLFHLATSVTFFDIVLWFLNLDLPSPAWFTGLLVSLTLEKLFALNFYCRLTFTVFWWIWATRRRLQAEAFFFQESTIVGAIYRPLTLIIA